ncbi:MAG TPA: hypothetical protein VFS40_12645 [Gemmatimonadales bacterium]|nr:hypothetical protein [Gemmatimonadales bacterium]
MSELAPLALNAVLLADVAVEAGLRPVYSLAPFALEFWLVDVSEVAQVTLGTGYTVVAIDWLLPRLRMGRTGKPDPRVFTQSDWDEFVLVVDKLRTKGITHLAWEVHRA